MKRHVRLFAVVACALFAFVFMGQRRPVRRRNRRASRSRRRSAHLHHHRPGAAYGEAITNGIKLARDEVNAKGEVFVDLKVEDSSGKQEQALARPRSSSTRRRSWRSSAPRSPTRCSPRPEANASACRSWERRPRRRGSPRSGSSSPELDAESQAIPASVGHAVKKYNIRKVALLYGTTTPSPSPASTR